MGITDSAAPAVQAGYSDMRDLYPVRSALPDVPYSACVSGVHVRSCMAKLTSAALSVQTEKSSEKRDSRNFFIYALSNSLKSSMMQFAIISAKTFAKV